MPYTSLDDIARKKAALKAKLKMQEKQMSALKTTLISPVRPAKGGNRKMGLLGRVDAKSILSATMTAFDGAWFAWKLYKKFKK